MKHHVAGSELDPGNGFIKIEGAPISGDLCLQSRFDLQECHRQSSTELTSPALQIFPAEFLCFGVASCKEKVADGWYGLPRGRIQVADRSCARPQRTLGQVQPLAGSASEDHGPEPDISHRQGLQPPV